MSEETSNKPRSFAYWAMRIHIVHRQLLQREVEPLGISAAQAYLLIKIKRNEDKSLSDLVEETDLSHPAIVRQVNDLEKLGLVRRVVSSKDKRVKYIALTSAGMELRPKVGEILIKIKKMSEFGFTQDAIDQTLARMENIHSNLMEYL